MPTTDAMKVQTVVMIRYAPHWDPESVSCTMKTHKTFTAVDKIITGIMLPRKNSSPFTEEVISVRSVFFSFYSARAAAVQYTLMEIFIRTPSESA